MQWAFLDTDIPSEIEVVALHRGDVYAEIRGGNPKLNMVMEVPFGGLIETEVGGLC